jgi:hypothetical protein
MRAALYLRVSTTDRQTTENQRRVLAKVAEHRGWEIVQSYEDFGISGAKGRDKRPAFDQMLKDAVRRKFDVTMCWSIDRLGRSVLHVANAMAELDAAGVALYSDQQALDSTSPFGKAMIQMACVFVALQSTMRIAPLLWSDSTKRENFEVLVLTYAAIHEKIPSAEDPISGFCLSVHEVDKNALYSSLHIDSWGRQPSDPVRPL